MWQDIVFPNCAKRDKVDHPSSYGGDQKKSSSKKDFITEDYVSDVKLSHDI